MFSKIWKENQCNYFVGILLMILFFKKYSYLSVKIYLVNLLGNYVLPNVTFVLRLSPLEDLMWPK